MVTETATTQSTRTVRRFHFDATTMTAAHWLAALLAVATGVVHVYLYVEQGFLPFLLAGVVFLAAVVGMLLNVYRRALYALGIPFTAGQIVIWYLQSMPDMNVAVVDKPIQVALILVLGYLLVTESR